MAEDKYAKYVKGTSEGKPKTIRVNINEGDPGYEEILVLKGKYNTEGIKVIIADALKRVGAV